MALYMLFLFLGMAAVWDYQTNRIPNVMLFFMFLMGAGIRFFYLDIWGREWIAIVMLWIFLMVLYGIRAMGGGDVKLLSLLFLYVGQEGVMVVMVAFMLAALSGVVLLLRSKQMLSRIAEVIRYVITCGRQKKLTTYAHGIGSGEAITIPFALCVFVAASMVEVSLLMNP